jgi:hypothetical protein
MPSDWIIVCPDRIKNVFIHLIMYFQYSLKIEDVIYNIEDILKVQSKKVILFGAQEVCKYGKDYPLFLFFNEVYLYNTEQLQSRNWDYMIVRSLNIKQWWDYSIVNIQYLQQNCFPLETRHIYFGYSPILELPLKSLDKNIITFFGTHHERRYNLCNKLQENLVKEGSNIIVEYNTSGNLYKEVYDEYISTHMIYLNIHYYTPSILEIVRIVPLLCQGHLVITEHSDDEYLDSLFNPYVIWLEDVIENISILLDRIKNHDNKKLKEEVKIKLNFNISNFI